MNKMTEKPNLHPIPIKNHDHIHQRIKKINIKFIYLVQKN